MEKIMLIFGTKPEAIKMCPLVNELKASNPYGDGFASKRIADILER